MPEFDVEVWRGTEGESSFALLILGWEFGCGRDDVGAGFACLNCPKINAKHCEWATAGILFK